MQFGVARCPPKAEVVRSNRIGSAILSKHLATKSNRLKPAKTERNRFIESRYWHGTAGALPACSSPPPSPSTRTSSCCRGRPSARRRSPPPAAPPVRPPATPSPPGVGLPTTRRPRWPAGRARPSRRAGIVSKALIAGRGDDDDPHRGVSRRPAASRPRMGAGDMKARHFLIRVVKPKSILWPVLSGRRLPGLPMCSRRHRTGLHRPPDA